MRVLMFGWEFPPHIAGGLGTACYGLTRGLAKQDVQVTFKDYIKNNHSLSGNPASVVFEFFYDYIFFRLSHICLLSLPIKNSAGFLPYGTGKIPIKQKREP